MAFWFLRLAAQSSEEPTLESIFYENTLAAPATNTISYWRHMKHCKRWVGNVLHVTSHQTSQTTKVAAC